MGNPVRVLIINDYAEAGGAEVVYRQSIDILSAMADVDVETFDGTNVDAPSSLGRRIWNFGAARQLQILMERFRPDRVWVHNYYNNLSPSILSVIARLRYRMGFRTYHTCHDYFLVFYEPAMVYRSRGQITPVPVAELGSLRALFTRSSSKGVAHDVLKKLHRHVIDQFIDPPSVFDTIFCPSTFMRDVVISQGINQAIFLRNPLGAHVIPEAPRPFKGDVVKLAFVGRLVPEKGLDQFLALAALAGFPRIETITIFGDGEERPRLEKKYAALIAAGRVTFVGNMSQKELFLALRQQHALVMSSIWYENGSMVILEAASLGLPALVHDIGGSLDAAFSPEIGNKILYQNNPLSLRTAMDRLIVHLCDRDEPYDLSSFSAERYGESLRALMEI